MPTAMTIIFAVNKLQYEDRGVNNMHNRKSHACKVIK